MSPLFFITQRIPLPLLRACGRYLGMVAAYFPTRDQKIALLQVKTFLPCKKPFPIVRAAYGSLGQTLAEVLHGPGSVLSTAEVSPRSEQALARALAHPHGVLILTAHTGNWEMTGNYLVQRGLVVKPIGRPSRSKILHRLLCEIRIRLGMKTLWRSFNAQSRNAVRNHTPLSSARELLDSLKTPGAICGLIDQDFGIADTFVNFFGSSCACSTSLINLALRTKTPLFFIFNERLPNQKLRIELHEIESPITVEEVLRQYHARLEELIRRVPEQWVWMHKRWRTLPDSTSMSSITYIEWLQHRQNIL